MLPSLLHLYPGIRKKQRSYSTISEHPSWKRKGSEVPPDCFVVIWEQWVWFNLCEIVYPLFNFSEIWDKGWK